MCQAIDEIREDSRNEGISIGRNEGRIESRKEIAIALLKKKTMPNAEIAELTKLSIGEVKQLQQELLQHV